MGGSDPGLVNQGQILCRRCRPGEKTEELLFYQEGIMKKLRVLAIRLQKYYQGEYTDWEDRPFLFTVIDDGLPLGEPNRKFWHGMAPTWQSVNLEHARVERDYGTINGGDEFDLIEIEWAREWPPERIRFGGGVPAMPGWIAPNGDYYPCPSWAHNSVAAHISLIEWGKETTRLEDSGWIAVRREVVGLPTNDKITERQRTTLYNISVSENVVMPGIPEYQIKKDAIRWEIMDLE